MADDGLIEALARAQANFAPITKGHINPHFKSKYADLADVLAAVRPALNAEGIALMQPIHIGHEGQVVLVTVLEGHGETRTASLPLYLDNMTPQQLLSTLTYYRRGMLAAMLGVAAEDDDDGNLAQEAAARRPIATEGNRLIPPAPQARQSSTVTSTPLPKPGASLIPEKPIAAMTVAELIAFARENGVTVSGSKSDMIRTLQPLVLAATGAEPFDLDAPAVTPVDPETRPFEPVVAGRAE